MSLSRDVSHPTRGSSPTSSRLTGLPKELRERILQYVLGTPEVTLNPNSMQDDTFPAVRIAAQLAQVIGAAQPEIMRPPGLIRPPELMQDEDALGFERRLPPTVPFAVHMALVSAGAYATINPHVAESEQVIDYFNICHELRADALWILNYKATFSLELKVYRTCQDKSPVLPSRGYKPTYLYRDRCVQLPVLRSICKLVDNLVVEIPQNTLDPACSVRGIVIGRLQLISLQDRDLDLREDQATAPIFDLRAASVLLQRLQHPGLRNLKTFTLLIHSLDPAFHPPVILPGDLIMRGDRGFRMRAGIGRGVYIRREFHTAADAAMLASMLQSCSWNLPQGVRKILRIKMLEDEYVGSRPAFVVQPEALKRMLGDDWILETCQCWGTWI